MISPESNVPKSGSASANTTYSITFIIAAMCAIFLTFVLATSEMDVVAKTRGFSVIIAGFLMACVCLHFWQNKRPLKDSALSSASEQGSRVESGLRALEETNEFFTGSITSADMFRLVSSRIGQLVNYRTSALLLLDETKLHLRVAEASGTDAAHLKNTIFDFDDGPISRSFSGHSVVVADSVSIAPGVNVSIAAIPLLQGIESFGVLCLYFDAGEKRDRSDTSLFEAIGIRVAPLVLSSLAREQTESNAMTDPATDLPNERAFYLLLENQVAQTVRSRESRPLTVLALDIKNFDDINQRFGHAAGDRALTFVSHIVKENLRQMDFLARATGDEFLAVLPTASREVSHEIIARIHTGFFGRRLKINDTETIEVELTFGWAAFGTDGETPNQLLAIARERKEQAKSVAPSKVLWFPQESVN